MSIKRVFCTYEDRETEFIGVAILVLSLIETTRHAEVFVYGKNVPTWFRTVIADHPSIKLCEGSPFASSGWSIKPEVLLKHLQNEFDNPVWLDADMVITSDLNVLIDRFDSSSLIVAEEPYWASINHSHSRAALWGLEPAREFTPSLNSCVVSARPRHAPLLERWKQYMQTREYLAAQLLAYSERSIHLAGDQEVLHALVTSRDFVDERIGMLRSGQDIAQCHLPDGYAGSDRIRNWIRRGVPGIVHAQGFKPWRPTNGRRPVSQDVSPYLYLARKYARQIPVDSDWCQTHSAGGRLLRLLTFGEPNLGGLLPAWWSRLRGSLRLRSRISAMIPRSRPSNSGSTS